MQAFRRCFYHQPLQQPLQSCLNEKLDYIGISYVTVQALDVAAVALAHHKMMPAPARLAHTSLQAPKHN